MNESQRARLIKQILHRRAQWERLYSVSYIERFFHPYDGELEALLDMAKAIRARQEKGGK